MTWNPHKNYKPTTLTITTTNSHIPGAKKNEIHFNHSKAKWKVLPNTHQLFVYKYFTQNEKFHKVHTQKEKNTERIQKLKTRRYAREKKEEKQKTHNFWIISVLCILFGNIGLWVRIHFGNHVTQNNILSLDFILNARENSLPNAN